MFFLMGSFWSGDQSNNSQLEQSFCLRHQLCKKPISYGKMATILNAETEVLLAEISSC